ncbi:MAG TPA: hypothetical protein VF139_14765 [Candidatus Polarisedimenticolaceae bacterium]
MPVLVDGDNLLGTWPGRTRSDAEKRALARECLALARRESREVLVVFDGREPVPAPPGEVRFAGAGRSADDLILEQLRRAKDPAGYTVVTNDRSLGDQARWLKARVERCDRFRLRLGAAPEAEKPEPSADFGYWWEQFGGGDG